MAQFFRVSAEKKVDALIVCTCLSERGDKKQTLKTF